MAVTVIAIGSSYAGAAAATALYGAAAVGTFAYIATSAVVAYGVSAVAGSAFGLDKADAQQFADTASGILINKSANDAPISVVYGQRKVGGTRVLMEITGANNEFLHMVLAISEGEIGSFENIYLNDVS